MNFKARVQKKKKNINQSMGQGGRRAENQVGLTHYSLQGRGRNTKQGEQD